MRVSTCMRASACISARLRPRASCAKPFQVEHDRAQSPSATASHLIQIDETRMCMLREDVPAVLFSIDETDSRRVLLLYMPKAAKCAARRMRSLYAPLANFNFSLQRTGWHLKSDGTQQRMHS
eukprot:6172576-Pleurochrysis_carterae.AAC.3